MTKWDRVVEYHFSGWWQRPENFRFFSHFSLLFFVIFSQYFICYWNEWEKKEAKEKIRKKKSRNGMRKRRGKNLSKMKFLINSKQQTWDSSSIKKRRRNNIRKAEGKKLRTSFIWLSSLWLTSLDKHLTRGWIFAGLTGFFYPQKQ
jgi:hypothetical protein